jgi:hypothetical protein
MTADTLEAQKSEPDPKPRIWALHCPFTKTGFPVLGNFGRTIRPVVVDPDGDVDEALSGHSRTRQDTV